MQLAVKMPQSISTSHSKGIPLTIKFCLYGSSNISSRVQSQETVIKEGKQKTNTDLTNLQDYTQQAVGGVEEEENYHHTVLLYTYTLISSQ